MAFDAPPNEGEYYPSVSGLEGCTSVVVSGFLQPLLTRPIYLQPLDLLQNPRPQPPKVLDFRSPYVSSYWRADSAPTQIIGEKGCWISHFWEAQSFEASDEIFQNTVIHSIEEGDDGSKNMKSPFNGDTKTRIPELADGEGETPFKPQIFISTPNDGGDGYLFNDRLTLIEQVLVGPGRAFEGVSL